MEPQKTHKPQANTPRPKLAFHRQLLHAITDLADALRNTIQIAPHINEDQEPVPTPFLETRITIATHVVDPTFPHPAHRPTILTLSIPQYISPDLLIVKERDYESDLGWTDPNRDAFVAELATDLANAITEALTAKDNTDEYTRQPPRHKT